MDNKDSPQIMLEYVEQDDKFQKDFAGLMEPSTFVNSNFRPSASYSFNTENRRSIINRLNTRTSSVSFNILQVRNPPEPEYLSDERLKAIYALIARDNSILKIEVDFFENFWRRHRSGSNEDREAYDEYFREFCENKVNADTTCAFKDYLKEEKEAKAQAKIRRSVTEILSAKSLRIDSGVSSSMRRSVNPEVLLLEPTQKLEILFQEVRVRKELFNKLVDKHKDECLNYRAKVEEAKIHRANIYKLRQKFDREVLGKTQLKQIGRRPSGETVLKYYDDVFRDRQHVLQVTRLKNANVRRRAKQVRRMMLSLDPSETNNITAQDEKMLKIENDEKILEFEAKTAETAELSGLLSRCMQNLKYWTRRFEEEKVILKGLNKEHRELQLNQKRADDQLRRCLGKSSTSTIEHDNNLALLNDYDTPEVLDYIRTVARVDKINHQIRQMEWVTNTARREHVRLVNKLKTMSESRHQRCSQRTSKLEEFL